MSADMTESEQIELQRQRLKILKDRLSVAQVRLDGPKQKELLDRIQELKGRIERAELDLKLWEERKHK